MSSPSLAANCTRRSGCPCDHPDCRVMDEPCVPTRQKRRGQRAQVGKDHAAQRFDRVAGRRNLVFECAAFRFVGLFETASRSVEFPTVVGTTNPVLGWDPVGERSTAVRAKFADETELTGAVLEEDQVLAEQPHAFGPALLHFFDCSHGMPVAALKVAHPRAGADVGERVFSSALNTSAVNHSFFSRDPPAARCLLRCTCRIARRCRTGRRACPRPRVPRLRRSPRSRASSRRH